MCSILLALMFMRFEAIPSVRKLFRRLKGRTYKLGWRAHTLVSMKALLITYIVRAVNVNDKDLVNPLMGKATCLLRLYGKRISHAIADSQYYSAEVFKTIRRYGAEPVIPPL